MQHMKKENRQKPRVSAGFVAGAEGLGLGCRLGCCSPVGSARHRPRREPRPAPGRSPPGCRPPRHAPQAGLRAHLVAKSYRTLTKKSGTAEAIPDFFGRGRRTWSPLPLRSARSLRATGTHSPLGTRFWSGCGRAHQGAGEGRCCPVLPASPKEDGAGLVLWGIFVAQEAVKSPL